MWVFTERLLTKEGAWAFVCVVLFWCIIKAFRWGARLFEDLVKGLIRDFLVPLKDRGMKWFDAQQANTEANTETLYQIRTSLKEHDERVTREFASINKRLP